MKIPFPPGKSRHEQPLGKQIESDACRWLKRQGLQIIGRNYHCRFGEIDIIARDNQTLVFVEVRFRSNKHFGTAAESVTPGKQKKIATTAAHYLQRHACKGQTACRFDVLTAHRSKSTEQFDFEWLQNAFFGHE